MKVKFINFQKIYEVITSKKPHDTVIFSQFQIKHSCIRPKSLNFLLNFVIIESLHYYNALAYQAMDTLPPTLHQSRTTTNGTQILFLYLPLNPIKNVKQKKLFL